MNSFIRHVALPTAVIAALLFAGCDLFAEEESQTEPPEGMLDFETLVKGPSPFEINSEARYEEATVVLTSENEEEAFLARRPYSSVSSFPAVDYDEHIVVGMIMPLRGGHSYEVTVDSVVAGTDVVVYATETGFTDVLRVISWPAHFVTLNRSDVAGRDIEFAAVERVCLRSPCAWERE